jgi:hypothetical protein
MPQHTVFLILAFHEEERIEIHIAVEFDVGSVGISLRGDVLG